MKYERIVRARVRRHGDGVDVVAGFDGVVAANVGERGSQAHVAASQRVARRSERRRGGPSGDRARRGGAPPESPPDREDAT